MMERNGDMTIVCHPHTMVKGSYSIADNNDGRLCVNSWKKFMDKELTFRMGDKMLFLLYQENAGAYLFVSRFPDDVLQ
jgi:hypothetical protein